MAPLVSEDPCRADPDLNTGSRQKGPGWFGMVWDVVLLCIIAIPTVPKNFREDDPHTRDNGQTAEKNVKYRFDRSRSAPARQT